MSGAWLSVALTALAVCAACVPSADTQAAAVRAVIATEVPAPGRVSGGPPSPATRYPTGSRLVRLDPTAPAARTILTEDLAAAGAPSVSHDGTRVVFVGKSNESDRYGVWTCAPDGADRTLVVDHPTDCGGAAFLPDGRIVYAAELTSPSPLPALVASALFVAPGDGSPGARITFSGGIDVDPWVLHDGRIAYVTYLPGEGMERGRFAVFTVHTDGTGAGPLVGERDDRLPRVRVTQAPGGDIWLSGTAGVAVVAWAHPGGERRAPTLPAAEPQYAVHARNGTLVVVGRDAEGRSGLWLGDGTEPLRPADGHVFAEAAAAGPGARPQGHLSMVKPEKAEGLLLAIDARAPGRPEATVARLSAVLADTPLCRKGARPLGDVQLAEDGSFFARVPADTPLLLDLLSESGEVVVRGITPFWVRPNEVRACVGCHETPDTAPPNRRPLAVHGDPVDLTGGDRDGEIR